MTHMRINSEINFGTNRRRHKIISQPREPYCIKQLLGFKTVKIVLAMLHETIAGFSKQSKLCSPAFLR